MTEGRDIVFGSSVERGPFTMDRRVERLGEVLDALLSEDFDAISTYEKAGDDAFGTIEETVQLLALDIKTMVTANRETEASLVMQQEALTLKRAELEAQRDRIAAQERELAARAETIVEQARSIRELSTPVLEVWTGVLVLPIIGALDSERAAEITAAVLRRDRAPLDSLRDPRCHGRQLGRHPHRCAALAGGHVGEVARCLVCDHGRPARGRAGARRHRREPW